MEGNFDFHGYCYYCWHATYAGNNGLLGNQQSVGIIASLAQLSDLIAALFTMFIFSRSSFRQIGWRLGPSSAYIAVFIILVANVALSSAVAFVPGFLHFVEQNIPKPMHLLMSFLVIFIASCIFSFADEFGWRGFLLPKLLPIAAKGALLVSGLIWFLWEAPLVYFSLLDSTMIHINLTLTLVCHFVQTCCIAISLGYLRLRFNSIFLSTFAHGLLNTMGWLSFILLVEMNPIGGDFGGPIGTVFLIIIALMVWH